MGEICQSIFVRFVWRILPVSAAKALANITPLIQLIKLFMMNAMARGRCPTFMKKIIEYSQTKKIFAHEVVNRKNDMSVFLTSYNCRNMV